VKARVSEKLSWLRYSKQSFYALFGCGAELYATILNEEHKVSVFAFAEDFLIVFVAGGGSASADLYEQAVGVNLIRTKCRSHAVSPFEAGAQTLSVTYNSPIIAMMQIQHFQLCAVPRPANVVYFSLRVAQSKSGNLHPAGPLDLRVATPNRDTSPKTASVSPALVVSLVLTGHCTNRQWHKLHIPTSFLPSVG
jgi:hypothetical protein